MAAGSKKTVSRCTTLAETGSHTFEIVGYSLKKGIGVGEHVMSGIFTVGGFDWVILFYPDGLIEGCKEYVSILLMMASRNGVARARYKLRLVSQNPEPWGKEWSIQDPMLFNFSSNFSRCAPSNPRFILRIELELESSKYICDDSIRIECDVTVIRESQLSKTREESEIEVPPCDITEHFGKLLKGKKGADITSLVQGDTFEAHKIVLAARSPVFMAEFYGQMRESGAHSVTIEDMQPAVFTALLHFIYTDSLPGMDHHLKGDDYCELIRHLLVAADRYAMERLKLVCQSILHKNLDVETVASTLALADQLNCDRLKAACVEFIASSVPINALVATQGYSNLKRSCPSILVDLYEKTSKLRKT